MSNIRKFFSLLSGNNKINFRYIHDTNKTIKFCNKFKFYSKEANEDFNSFNSQGYGVFFMPNTGTGYKNEDVTKFNACFVDLDLKDEITLEILIQFEQTGMRFKTEKELKTKIEEKVKEKLELLTPDQHANYKKIFMDKIKVLSSRYGIKPSAIVESRNGYHVYYFLEDGVTLKQFEDCQERLINYYGADQSVKSPAQLLRVPDTYHLKNPNDPFKIKLLILNEDVRYPITGLTHTVPSQGDLRGTITKRLVNLDIVPPKSPTDSTPKVKSVQNNSLIVDFKNVRYIKKSFDQIESFKQLLELDNLEAVEFITKDDILDYLKKQDLAKFLGVAFSKSFCCLFHNDSKPSASIYPNKETGHYIYKCHSPTCSLNKGMTIIHIAEMLTGLKIHKSLQYLMQLYNVTKVKTEWQQEQEELIEENLFRIESFRHHKDEEEQYKNDLILKENFPNTYKMLNHEGMLNMMKQIHYIAREMLPYLAKIESRENVIVFASIEYILNQMGDFDEFSRFKGGKKQRVSIKLAILVFLHLLNRVGLDEIPPEDARRSKKEKLSGTKFKNSIYYYELNSLDVNLLQQVEEMAKDFYENGMTLKHFDREMLIRLKGQVEADRVFPDRKNEKISKENDIIANALTEKMLQLIDQKGWTYEKEIVRLVEIPGLDIKELYRKKYLAHIKKDKNKESIVDTIPIADNDPHMMNWYLKHIRDKLKKVIGSIVNDYGLTKKNLNKELIAHFNINDPNLTGFPSIYYK